MTAGPPTTDGEDALVRAEAARLFSDLLIRPPAGRFVEGETVCIGFDLRPGADDGPFDGVVTVFPVTGGSDCLEGLTLALLPEEEGGVIRFGKIDGRGQLLFTALARAGYRARLLGQPVATAGEPQWREAPLVLRVAQPGAAAAVATRWARELETADGMLSARLSLVSGRLELAIRAARELNGSLAALSYRASDGTVHRLLVALAWDERLDQASGDAHLGPAPDELLLGPPELEAVPPTSLTGDSRPLITDSVAHAAFHRDRMAWHALAAHPEVAREARLAITDALSDAGFAPR